MALTVAAAAVVYLLLHKKPQKEEYVDLKWQSADGVELDFGTWKGSKAKWLSLYFEANIEEPVKLIEAIKSTSLYDEKLHFERTKPNGSWTQLFYIVKENRIFYIRIYDSGYIEMDSLLSRDTQFYYSGSDHTLYAMAHWLRETDDNEHYTGWEDCYKWQTPVTMEDLKYLYGKLDDSLQTLRVSLQVPTSGIVYSNSNCLLLLELCAFYRLLWLADTTSGFLLHRSSPPGTTHSRLPPHSLYIFVGFVYSGRATKTDATCSGQCPLLYCR